MIDRSHRLPITRQAKALGIARSTIYALPRPVSDRDLELMKQIDRYAFAGSRMLMKRMGIPQAAYDQETPTTPGISVLAA